MSLFVNCLFCFLGLRWLFLFPPCGFVVLLVFVVSFLCSDFLSRLFQVDRCDSFLRHGAEGLRCSFDC